MAVKGIQPQSGKSGGWTRSSQRPSAERVGNHTEFTQCVQKVSDAAGMHPSRNLRLLTNKDHARAEAMLKKVEVRAEKTIDYLQNILPKASQLDLNVQTAGHNCEVKMAEHSLKARESYTNKVIALESFRGQEAVQDFQVRNAKESATEFSNSLLKQASDAIDRALVAV